MSIPDAVALWLALHPRAALVLGVAVPVATGVLTALWCAAVGLP